jgi:hypothetical protein
MVELDVVYDDQFGKVMNKFRPLVEERGVVFVPLENEMLGVSKGGPLAEVFRNAPDKITGLEPALEDPREERRGVALPWVPVTTRVAALARRTARVSGSEDSRASG